MFPRYQLRRNYLPNLTPTLDTSSNRLQESLHDFMSFKMPRDLFKISGLASGARESGKGVKI